MYDFEIQYVLDRSPYTCHWNTIVCALDELPARKPKHVQAYVINTDPAHEPGEHWVALLWDKDINYFDSYGLPPLKPIKRFLQGTSWNENVWMLQQPFSSVCGLYCIFMLHHLSMMSMKDIITYSFNENDTQNDEFILQWFLQTYGTLYKEAQHIDL